MNNQAIQLFTVEFTSRHTGERVQRTLPRQDRAAEFFRDREALGLSPSYVETPASTRAILDRLVRK